MKKSFSNKVNIKFSTLRILTVRTHKELTHRQQKKENAFLLCASIFLFSFYVFSCSSMPKAGESETFGMIGKKADIYAFIPVKGNEAILNTVLTEFTGSAASSKKAISRTSCIYAGIFSNNLSPELRFCLEGSYPAGAAGWIFKKNSGWEKKQSENGYYYSSGYMDAAIPSRHLVCASLGQKDIRNMAGFLSLVKSPEQPVFNESFRRFVSSPDIGGKMGIFIKNTEFFLSKIIGTELDLPINSIEIYFEKNKTMQIPAYNYKLYIKVQNAAAGFAARILLSKLLKTDIKLTENVLSAENGYIHEQQLANLIRSLYR